MTTEQSPAENVVTFLEDSDAALSRLGEDREYANIPTGRAGAA